MTQTHPVVATVPIELDRERNLLLDFNALCMIEQATGKNYLDPRSFARLDLSTIRAIVWAGLLHEDQNISFDDFGRMQGSPELSVAAVGRLIQGKIAYVSKCVSEAFAAMRKAQPADPKKPTKK